MAAFVAALVPIAAGACFPSLADLTSGDGVDAGEDGKAGKEDANTGRDGEPDRKTVDTGGAVSDVTDRDSLSSHDASPEDSSRKDASDVDASDLEASGEDAPQAVDAPSGVDAEDASCAADTTSDPANCGTCGHDCLGGKCTAGQCQPITLATTSGSVGIAIDSTYVYWANTSTTSAGIYKINKTLTGPGTPLAVETGATYEKVQGLASDGSYVYWTNKATGATGSVQRALPTGGGLTTLVTGQNQPDWIAVTVDGTDVVWTNQGTNQVMATPVTSSGATPTALNTTNELGTLPAGIAIDATTVYYATKTTGGGEAESVPLAGGMVSQLGPATYVGITVDNDNVYWTGGFASPIVSQNAKGGDPSGVQVIASGGALTCPLHLVSDGNNVYFFDQGTTTAVTDAGPAGTIVAGAGALYRVPVGNSAKLPKPIVSGLTDPQAVVEDATALYWVTGGTSGAVMKLAK